MAVSALFSNQIAAFFATLGILLVLWLIGLPAQAAGPVGGGLLDYLDFSNHFYETLYRGVIDLADIVYYLSVTALALFLGTMVIEIRRWAIMKPSLRKFAPLGLYLALIAALAAVGIYLVMRAWNLAVQISLGLVLVDWRCSPFSIASGSAAGWEPPGALWQQRHRDDRSFRWNPGCDQLFNL